MSRKTGINLFFCMNILTSLFACSHENQPSATIDLPPVICDQSGDECLLGDKVNQLTVSWQPEPIRLMEEVDLSIKSLAEESVDIHRFTIEGMNMPMGLIRTELNQTETGQWKGKFLLPICSERSMQWQMNFEYEHQDKVYRQGLQFYTQR